MKTKITVLRSSCLALSLLGSTGVAFAVAEVESHAQSGWIQGSPSGDPTGNPTLDLMRKIEFLQQEVQELRGKVEEQSYQLGKLKNEPLKESAGANVGVNTGADLPVESVAPMNMPVPMGSILQDQTLAEEKAYQHAYHLIQSKDYNGATLAFKSLIKTFPEGKYIPNAHYWLGEIYMAKGDLQLAYDAFDSVFKQYPDHPKAADSLLKLGYVEYAKGQWKRSQALLQQVKNQFPGSTSAQLAEAKLQSMQKEGN